MVDPFFFFWWWLCRQHQNRYVFFFRGGGISSVSDVQVNATRSELDNETLLAVPEKTNQYMIIEYI